MVGRKYFEGGSGTMKPHHGDFALACKLAFYTGGGYDQMRRIFPKSSLVREKTLETGGNSDYLEVVLRHAIATQKRIGACPTSPLCNDHCAAIRATFR
jgi:primase-polymerase (primpol)-like protein